MIPLSSRPARYHYGTFFGGTGIKVSKISSTSVPSELPRPPLFPPPPAPGRILGNSVAAATAAAAAAAAA